MPDTTEHLWVKEESSPRRTVPETQGPKAAEDLLPLVYSELRRLAAAKMASQPPGHTLQATALVHEAYLRLKGSGREGWANRAHFFAASAEAMRQILVESARRKRALRHGGGQERLDIADLPIAIELEDDKILQVDEALELLRREDATKAEVVKLRYFVGLNHGEIAEVLGLSEKTVQRYWAYAKVWLYQHIQPKSGE
jgi:RNA polymerase sigma factor (TIGR02999 family)